MKKLRPKRISKHRAFARLMAGTIRHPLEGLHGGKFPVSKTGDYSDVKVVTPDREIAWNELSRISGSEMRGIMLEAEEAIRKALEFYDLWQDGSKKISGKTMLELIKMEHFGENGISWDRPYLDKKKS